MLLFSEVMRYILWTPCRPGRRRAVVVVATEDARVSRRRRNDSEGRVVDVDEMKNLERPARRRSAAEDDDAEEEEDAVIDATTRDAAEEDMTVGVRWRRRARRRRVSK
jgi:hypothetical protein